MKREVLVESGRQIQGQATLTDEFIINIPKSVLPQSPHAHCSLHNDYA